ncbi:MAG: molybdopterin-dependent oxidoreductase [Syntrophales bacterium]|jgi:anaerobic selenocysteine-containing dehydrogenase|nr:molybdopterin-dependent oxidoreductase [Syntrophales bacterium]MDY0045194.1 molybdopterin-dependent oxidoreductase [Syntrophales bacterium]
MSWKKTSCVLCGNRCGLEVQVEDNRIVKVRGDKDSPISEGYVCRKGLNVAYHQHNTDRLQYPLKKVGDRFERISWEQTIGEIAEKLKGILAQHGPRSLASMVGGGEFAFLSIGFPVRFVRRLGSRWNYSAANQEFSGRYWAHGLTLGSQNIQMEEDFENCDMLILIGKNPMMAHHFPQAPRRLQKMSKDPDRLLVVVDPRLTETARLADIHLAIRPGTDALLLKSMIAIILNEGIYNKDYIAQHADGFNKILPWFAGFDVRAALKVCDLDYDTVFRVCREFATRRSSIIDDLGILMGRHSAFNSYLLVVLQAICGRLAVPGGNYLHGGGTRSDPRDPKVWRTLLTDIPAINGMFPPNVLPEEIMHDHPERLRAVLCWAANPLRSYADTTAYEKAFQKLDLLVVAEIAMSETAALAHYVLPCKTAFESWEGDPGMGFEKVYARLRGPVVEAEGEQKENAEIFTLLADAMGLIPPIPDALYEAAKSGDLNAYGQKLGEFMMASRENAAAVHFVVAKTLGPALGSAHLASIFPLFMLLSKDRQEEAARAGFPAGPDQGLSLYRAIMDHPQGVLIGIRDPEKNLEANVSTKNKKIQLYNPEVEDWIRKINPAEEEAQLKQDANFPLILMAGKHMDMNANTAMRDPAWNKNRRACTLAIHPADAEALGIIDKQMVKVVTEAGEETLEAEISKDCRKGQVVMPQGFGLFYDGVTYGANVNRLTKNTNRDFVGTPMHRYVPCRVETIG